MQDRFDPSRREVRHPAAQAEAKILVARHDGSASRIVERDLEQRLTAGDVDGALHLDQVRREIERTYG